MKNVWRMLMGLAALVVTLGYASADERAANFFSLQLRDYSDLSDTIGQCAENCIIVSNNGGFVSSFKNAAEIVKRRNMRVIIDGQCYSACAVFADAATPQVCITKKAEFYFHLGTIYENLPVYFSFTEVSEGKVSWKLFTVSLPVSRFEPEQSPLVRDWIIEHGGFPSEGFLKMDYGAAKSFWPTC